MKKLRVLINTGPTRAKALGTLLAASAFTDVALVAALAVAGILFPRLMLGGPDGMPLCFFASVASFVAMLYISINLGNKRIRMPDAVIKPLLISYLSVHAACLWPIVTCIAANYAASPKGAMEGGFAAGVFWFIPAFIVIYNTVNIFIFKCKCPECMED